MPVVSLILVISFQFTIKSYGLFSLFIDIIFLFYLLGSTLQCCISLQISPFNTELSTRLTEM